MFYLIVILLFLLKISMYEQNILKLLIIVYLVTFNFSTTHFITNPETVRHIDAFSREELHAKTNHTRPETSLESLYNEIAEMQHAETNHTLSEMSLDSLYDGIMQMRHAKTNHTRPETSLESLYNEIAEMQHAETNHALPEMRLDSLYDAIMQMRHAKTNHTRPETSLESFNDDMEVTQVKTNHIRPRTRNQYNTEDHHINSYKMAPRVTRLVALIRVEKTLRYIKNRPIMHHRTNNSRLEIPDEKKSARNIEERTKTNNSCPVSKRIHSSSHFNEMNHIEYHINDTLNQVDHQPPEFELGFLYFKTVDYDNNDKLDGCEIWKTILFVHKEDSSDSVTESVDSDELAHYIDPILKHSDLNFDGFLDFPEFILLRKNRQLNF